MKKYNFTFIAGLLIFLLGKHSNAQEFTLEWAKQISGSLYENGFSIAVDNFGNVYTTGHFSGTADFYSKAR
jgi:hypothetical protein